MFGFSAQRHLLLAPDEIKLVEAHASLRRHGVRWQVGRDTAFERSERQRTTHYFRSLETVIAAAPIIDHRSSILQVASCQWRCHRLALCVHLRLKFALSARFFSLSDFQTIPTLSPRPARRNLAPLNALKPRPE